MANFDATRPCADKAQFERPEHAFGPFSSAIRRRIDSDQDLVPVGQLDLPKLSNGVPQLPTGMMNITPNAGDILMIPETLVHGALPWLPCDRDRRILMLRYRPHGRPSEAGLVKPHHILSNRAIVQRLAPETRELIEPVAEGTKAVALFKLFSTTKMRRFLQLPS